MGKGYCGKPCPIMSKFKVLGSVKEEFSGSSPPSVFVGRIGYPDIFSGILAPAQTESEAWMLDSPEQWYARGMKIEDILGFRSQMIYSRFRANVRSGAKLMEVQQEVACSNKPCEIEVKLEKKPSLQIKFDNYSTPLANPANANEIKLSSNPAIPVSVEKITSDTDMKSKEGVKKLYEKNVEVSNIHKIFSTGLLGTGTERKLVPTRWAITATDDIISKSLLENIRDFHQLGEYMLFSNTYLGNHYEILLMPRQWSFELIEAKFPGSLWNPESQNISIHADYENWHPRKKYASNTVGGYYATRLAATEHLIKIRRQASVFIIRECMPEYFAPLGVWVCRETCRHAFDKNPEKFQSLKTALEEMKSRLKMKWHKIESISMLLKEIRAQRTLFEF